MTLPIQTGSALHRRAQTLQGRRHRGGSYNPKEVVQEVGVLLDGALALQQLRQAGHGRHQALGGVLHQAAGLRTGVHVAPSLLVYLVDGLQSGPVLVQYPIVTRVVSLLVEGPKASLSAVPSLT